MTLIKVVHTCTVLVSSAVVKYDIKHRRKTDFWLHWAFNNQSWIMVRVNLGSQTKTLPCSLSYTPPLFDTISLHTHKLSKKDKSLFQEPVFQPLRDMWDGSIPPRQQPVKLQGAKFKTTEIPQLKFLKHTSILHHFKDTPVVNQATLSDFKKALRRKHNK
jgi:hypothetical protein